MSVVGFGAVDRAASVANARATSTSLGGRPVLSSNGAVPSGFPFRACCRCRGALGVPRAVNGHAFAAVVLT